MKKITPIIILLIIFSNTACRKYKDDSFVSFRTPLKRVLGNWKIVAFEVDGADSLQHYQTDNNYCDDITFYKDNNNYYFGICQAYEHDFSIGKTVTFLYVDLINKNRKSRLAEYNILKLYRNDFWVQKDENGKNYVLKYTKQ